MHDPVCLSKPIGLNTTKSKPKYANFKNRLGASLVVQWLRILLPMQGTRVRALVREDPTCRVPQLLRLRSRAPKPQLLKPARLELVPCSKRSHCNEKPAHHNEE